MTIPQSFIQELLARTDVVDIVGRYVPLKKAGANFMGLCPFHGEKSPSFSVSPSKQFFHCFGCGKNGNAIGFLMEHAGMGFREAVEDLAQQYGLQVPDDDVSPHDKARAAEQRQKQLSLSEVLEKAGDAYRKQLKVSPRAVNYLKGRGLSGEVAKRFGLGYAPEGWRSLASVFAEYDSPLLAECGLVIVSDEDGRRYDRFRDRIMFPIRNVKGECIGFGGRVLGDEKPKYLNSPETPVFSKGRELYGLYEARTALREQGYALVTEGYMDVVALAQLGFPNAVATLGTACTTDHVHKLFRFTDSVVFSFDGDAAGRRAARKALDGAIPYATDTRSVKFLFLPAEHDPDSFIREYGPDAFSRHVGDALPLSRFLIEAAREHEAIALGVDGRHAKGKGLDRAGQSLPCPRRVHAPRVRGRRAEDGQTRRRRHAERQAAGDAEGLVALGPAAGLADAAFGRGRIEALRRRLADHCPDIAARHGVWLPGGSFEAHAAAKDQSLRSIPRGKAARALHRRIGAGRIRGRGKHDAGRCRGVAGQGAGAVAAVVPGRVVPAKHVEKQAIMGALRREEGWRGAGHGERRRLDLAAVGGHLQAEHRTGLRQGDRVGSRRRGCDARHLATQRTRRIIDLLPGLAALGRAPDRRRIPWQEGDQPGGARAHRHGHRVRARLRIRDRHRIGRGQLRDERRVRLR